MKIWEFLTEEYVGKLITNGDNSLKLSISKNPNNNDILLTDGQGNNMAISKLLIDENWELVEFKGWERNNANSNYFYITDTGRVMKTNEDLTVVDEFRFIHANYFTTREKAEEVLTHESINRRLMKFADENNSEIDWKSMELKYHLSFNPFRNEVEIHHSSNYREVGTVYFSSEEIAQQALELFRDEICNLYK